jgi:hypothetical protein
LCPGCKKKKPEMLINSVFLAFLKQITGIEPASPAWEAGVLPMNYICACLYYSISDSKIKNKITKKKTPGGTRRLFLSYEGGDSDI